MARDSLRSTLDELKLDEGAAHDRPYLEAMLRRLGYTETEIRAELGPPAEAEPGPPADAEPAAEPAGDGLAPAREYRLVVPARESAFSFENPAADGPDSPFEAFERVEFEETLPTEEALEFTEEPQPLEFTEEPQPLEAAEAPLDEPAAEPVAFEEAQEHEFQPAQVEELQAEEPATVEDVSIDTFGGPDVAAAPRTRVRVKRVRAKSKEEAESKVSSSNRRVIKSIPVDIVERWGDKEARP